MLEFNHDGLVVRGRDPEFRDVSGTVENGSVVLDGGHLNLVLEVCHTRISLGVALPGANEVIGYDGVAIAPCGIT